MRPIIRRSAQLRDRNIQRADAATPTHHKARSRLVPAAARDKTELSRRHAAIPQALSAAYTVAPISRINADPSTAPKSNVRFKGGDISQLVLLDENWTDYYALRWSRYEGATRCLSPGIKANVAFPPSLWIVVKCFNSHYYPLYE